MGKGSGAKREQESQHVRIFWWFNRESVVNEVLLQIFLEPSSEPSRSASLTE